MFCTGAVAKSCCAATVLLATVFSLDASVESGTNVFSQGKFDKEFRARSWTTDDGLPQNTILSLLQASDGYLWIGTLDGLVRYDGVKFTVYDKQNTPAFRNHAILSLAEGPPGSIWIGTPDGMLRYREHQFEWLELRAQRVAVRSICPRRTGGLWLGTDIGPARFENATFLLFSNYPPYTPLRGEPVNHFQGVETVTQDPSGTLWVGDDRGVVRLRPGKEDFEVVYPPDGNRGDAGHTVLTLSCDGEGGIWFGDNAGLHRWSEQGMIHYPAADIGLPTGRLDPLSWDSRHGLIIRAFDGGLSLFGKGCFANYPGQDTGVAGDWIRCALADREGNIWAGANASGLRLFQPRKVRNFTTADGLAHNDVWGISQAPDGSMWIATGHGLSRYHDGNFDTSHCEVDANPDHDKFAGLVTTRDGTVWAASAAGLIQFKAGKFLPVPKEVQDIWYPRLLGEDNRGALWISGSSALFRLQGEQWETWGLYREGSADPKLILPDARVIGALTDNSGDVWVGTSGGVCRFNENRSERFTSASGLPTEGACPVLADKDGTVWFASERGLIRFRTGHFALISESNGLFENLIYHVLEDDFGWLWMNGNRGLQKARKAELNDFADGKLERVRCVHYGIADGMLSAEGNGNGPPNSCKARDGQLWFPTTKGVVVVDPRTLRDNDVPPSVIIEQVVADGEIMFGDDRGPSRPGPKGSLGEGSSLRLGPGRARSLIIRYTANTFVSPEKVRFQNQLVGEQKTWQEDRSNLRTAIYTDLRPGNYLFRLRAFNNAGVRSNQDAVFAFSLAPHFYQTWPFYVLCAMGILSMGGSLHAIRMTSLKRIKALEQRHALELERARIARDMHDSLGADLTKITLLAQVAQRQNGNGDQRRNWERVSGLAGGLVDGIGELVWATNPRNNSLDNLAAYIREYAVELFESVGIIADLDFPTQIPPFEIAGETRRNLFLAVKEALTNVVKHAQASRVCLSFSLVEEVGLLITIKDDGKGFKSESSNAGNGAGNGNGLRHLRERLAAAGGCLEIESIPGSGTLVRMSIPLTRLSPDQALRQPKSITP